jgi:biotin carboxyl carrier protein
MPGRVVQLHASPGARVTAGELLAVVESMKVQFNVPAPADGTVAEVCCEVGRIVELGDVLVRLEV